jgi:hypothetical protein
MRYLWYAVIALGAWWVGRHWDEITFAREHRTQLEGAGEVVSGFQKLFGGQ